MATPTTGGAGAGAHIGAHDAVPGCAGGAAPSPGGGPSASPSAASFAPHAAAPSSASAAAPLGTYADDDSAVSSQVTDDGSSSGSGSSEEESSSDGRDANKGALAPRSAQSAASAPRSVGFRENVRALPPPRYPGAGGDLERGTAFPSPGNSSSVNIDVRSRDVRDVGETGDDRGRGVLPRNKREWCLIFFFVVAILVVALGTSIGLGYYFVNRGGGDGGGGGGGSGGDERKPPPAGTGDGGGVDGGGGENDVVGAPPGGDDDTLGGGEVDEDFDAVSPNPGEDDATASNQTSNQTPPSPIQSGGGDDDGLALAAAIEAHLIDQEISDVTSLQDLGASDASGTPPTAQARARDFLVMRDRLPLAMTDDGEDDPLAIGSPSDAQGDSQTSAQTGAPSDTRPYLGTSTPAYRVAQRYSAAVLYYALGGERWDDARSWIGPGVHECDWAGVACRETEVPGCTLAEALEDPEGFEASVAAVEGTDANAAGSNLGSNPAQWRSAGTTTMRTVIAIDLPENDLSGSLPREIAGLPYLRRLGLWSNDISGTLPPELGTLRRLEVLHLDDNLFSGEIPPEFGGMESLKDLSLDLNEGIAGEIPTELGRLPNLERLRLSNASLRGPVPTELGNLNSLGQLFLQGNMLTGDLPDDLSRLSSTLQMAVVSDNRLSGDIPESWEALTSLTRLEVQGNDMAFDLAKGEGVCALRDDAGGTLTTLIADCGGSDPKVTCECCTACR
ncbi:hypothetical protein ACHAWF_015756 [Thalassiosira exigua]